MGQAVLYGCSNTALLPQLKIRPTSLISILLFIRKAFIAINAISSGQTCQRFTFLLFNN